MKFFNSGSKTISSSTLQKDIDTPSTRILLIRIWSHLGKRRKIQLIVLLITMFISGLAELVSLGAVLPFLLVLSNPERLWRQPLIQPLIKALNYTEASQLLPLATLGFVLATVLAALVRLFNLWLNLRMAAIIGSDLSCKAYQRTLYQPYKVHLQQNSSTVISTIITQTAATVSALKAFLQVVTSVIVASGLLLGLVFIDAQMALSAVALFGASYGFLVLLTRQRLRLNGERIAVAVAQQAKALQEGLAAIRDVLLDNNQNTYVQIYQKADRPQKLFMANTHFLGAFPRFVIEALGIVGLSLIGFLIVSQRGTAVAIIPVLGVFALGAQRLLPALQHIYSGWAALKGYNAAIESVLVLLDQHTSLALVDKFEPLSLQRHLRLDDVGFSYGSKSRKVLKGINLDIRKGERIGLIGATGSGKSTLVDLLMGLLDPTCGCVMVDGKDLHDPKYPDRLKAWQASIAHVPQNIYLADSSIAENIAFGVPSHEIDFNRVRQAAKKAQISSFIEDQPQGYEGFVGERGIRLSGGQRQRIGIARALYKKATFLVLDEATSALDIDTEDAVMEAVEGLSDELTIIMIAHRLTTVQRCDRVIRLSQGLVSACGPPNQVLA